MTCQFQKNVLKVREDGAEISNPDVILGQTMNHLGDKIVAGSANRELRVAADHRLYSRDRSKALLGVLVVCRKHDGSFRAVPVNEALRPVDVHDPPMLDDGHAVA